MSGAIRKLFQILNKRMMLGDYVDFEEMKKGQRKKSLLTIISARLSLETFSKIIEKSFFFHDDIEKTF